MKSTICEGPFPIQVLLNKPDTRILFDSQDMDSSRGFLTPVRHTFESKMFREIHGELRDDRDWNQNQITIRRDSVSPQSSIMTSGVGESPTGQHWELIIADDLQTELNSKNREQRQKVIDRVKMYDNLLDQSGMAVIVGTRWAFDDVMQFLEDQEKEDRRYGRPKRIFLNKKSAHKKNEEGKFTTELEFPGLLDQDELNYARASQGAFLYSCNYECEPMSDENAIFKKEWIRYHEFDVGSLPAGSKIYMAIDPAGFGEQRFRGADYHGIVVAAVSPTGDCFVLYAIKAHWTDQKLMEEIGRIHSAYLPIRTGIEQVFGQHQLKAWLYDELRKKGKIINFEHFKNTNMKKEARIQALAPRFELGKIFLRSSMTELEDELLQFPKGEHDDIADALAYAWLMADVPTEPDIREFWRDPEWKEKGLFKPEDGISAPPDSTSLAVRRAEEAEKKYKTKRTGRFVPLSRFN
jgi:predicted phage terminase large subunit-like protein